MWSGTAVEQALGSLLQTPPASLAWTAEGVSIDSRTLVAGDLFVALRGQQFDGNQYLSAAHQAQAAAAIAETLPPSTASNLPVFQVKDGLAGLVALAEAARESAPARRLAITGSSGKTSWRKLLTLALAPLGEIHAAEKSHNNRIGVALTLARLPKSAELAVLELGSNELGEIADLTALVRPEIGVITGLGTAHIGKFGSAENLAHEKMSLLHGLIGMRLGVVRQADLPVARNATSEQEVKLHSFATGQAGSNTTGKASGADAYLAEWTPAVVGLAPFPTAGEGVAKIFKETIRFKLSSAAHHQAENAVGALLVAKLLGASLKDSADGLADFSADTGRGEVLRLPLKNGDSVWVLDDSYNANFESMVAALETLAQTGIRKVGTEKIGTDTPSRRLAVLGEMRELGEESQKLHQALAKPLLATQPDAVFLVGTEMQSLAEILRSEAPNLELHFAPNTEEIRTSLESHLQANDIVLFKGSLSVGINALLGELRQATKDTTEHTTEDTTEHATKHTNKHREGKAYAL